LEPLLSWLRARLGELADPVVAEGARRFFPAGQKARHYGVATPAVRALAREAVDAEVQHWPLAKRNRLCQDLWKSGMMEEGVLAIEIYRRFARQCGPCEFRLFEKWIERFVRNWAHCDGVCCYLIRAVLARHPELAIELPAWTASPNRWKRRAAAVSLVHEVRARRHVELAFEICDRLSGDEDDMVRKGIGWLLKNAYLRNPKPTMRFLLTPREPEFARTVLRYAAGKMTAADRRRALG
jgi:3-methyladenine DNA glycosylase AlkD